MDRRAARIPVTVVGQSLLAIWQRDDTRRAQLTPRLNNGQPGWNDDEPTVAKIACELVLAEYFPADYDVREVTEFARELMPVLTGRYALNVLQIEELLRACLGDAGVDIGDIAPHKRYITYGLAAGLAMVRLGYDDHAMERVASEAETIALSRGIPLSLVDA